MSGAVLVVVRGNSGSGKTTTAREVHRRYGRGCALLEQDYLRRVVLREHGGIGPDAVAPGFIATCARTLLGSGYHVILEGILHTGSYGSVLRKLIADHAGPSHVYYLDVGFEETIRRHHSREEPILVTAEQMHDWYAPHDVLGVDGEHIIPQTFTLEQTVTTILNTSGLLHAAPATPCPTRCPRCSTKQAPQQPVNGSAQPEAMECEDGSGC